MSNNMPFSPYGVTDMSSMCYVHNKKRGQRNLQPSQTSPGMFECRPEDPCKGSSNVSPQVSYNPGMFSDPSAELMNMNIYGAMPAPRTPVRFNPYARDPTICIVHNKKRGANNLQDSKTVPGAFECLPTDQCKGATTLFGAPDPSQGGICHIHGKRRGARNLVAHPSIMGAQVCQETDPCK